MNAKQLEFDFDEKPEPTKIIEPIYQGYFPTGSTVNTNYFRITSLTYTFTATSGSYTIRYI